MDHPGPPRPFPPDHGPEKFMIPPMFDFPDVSSRQPKTPLAITMVRNAIQAYLSFTGSRAPFAHLNACFAHADTADRRNWLMLNHSRSELGDYMEQETRRYFDEQLQLDAHETATAIAELDHYVNSTAHKDFIFLAQEYPSYEERFETRRQLYSKTDTSTIKLAVASHWDNEVRATALPATGGSSRAVSRDWHLMSLQDLGDASLHDSQLHSELHRLRKFLPGPDEKADWNGQGYKPGSPCTYLDDHPCPAPCRDTKSLTVHWPFATLALFQQFTRLPFKAAPPLPYVADASFGMAPLWYGGQWDNLRGNDRYDYDAGGRDHYQYAFERLEVYRKRLLASNFANVGRQHLEQLRRSLIQGYDNDDGRASNIKQDQ
jgi:hypothetical protein